MLVTGYVIRSSIFLELWHRSTTKSTLYVRKLVAPNSLLQVQYLLGPPINLMHTIISSFPSASPFIRRFHMIRELSVGLPTPRSVGGLSLLLKFLCTRTTGRLKNRSMSYLYAWVSFSVEHISIGQSRTRRDIYSAKRVLNSSFCLAQSRRISLFCDHANLTIIFSPAQSVKRHIRGKIQRWALHLFLYRYNI